MTLLTTTGLTAQAQLGVCGSLDLRRVSNSDVVNLIVLNDLSSGRTATRVQCGLGKESLPICTECSSVTTEDMMAHLRPLIGQPSHLEWHLDWHKTRAKNLTPLDFSAAVTNGIIPAGETFETFSSSHLITGNLAGEDFFYMHRLMIKMTQIELAAANKPCMAPWQNLPDSVRDDQWPVPRNLNGDSVVIERLERELATFRQQFSRLRNPTMLSRVTLARLGQVIEAGLHQSLHGFYRSNPACSPQARAQGFCDDLLPPETSPLNKYFWKIHTLVDGLLASWLDANGYDEIAVSCDLRAKCYQWKSTWVGRYPQTR